MEVMNITEAAEFLRISVNTLHQWCHLRKVPYYRTGKLALFNKVELEKWILSHRVKTSEELMAEAEGRMRGRKIV